VEVFDEHQIDVLDDELAIDHPGTVREHAKIGTP
jgi:hypothetical protein